MPNAEINKLFIQGNPIADSNAFDTENTISNILLSYTDSINFDAPALKNCYNLYIIDCPADKQVAISNSAGALTVKFTTEDEGLKQMMS